MQIDKKHWDMGYKDEDVALSYTREVIGQPSFGIEIAWNMPNNLLKPYIVVNFWRWMVQVGWLV